MLNDRHKVVLLSIVAGLFAGLIDALVGYFVFSEDEFLDLLILDVPVHELYIRTFLMLSFIVFGLIISRYLSRSKRAEEAQMAAIVKAQDEKAKSQAIIAAIGDGISIQDTDFRIMYQNQIHKNLIGDHAGKHCYEVYERRDNVCEGCPVAESFRDGGIHITERTMRMEKGMSHFEITASPLRDSEGKIIAGIEVVRDITDRRKLEEQLLHAHKMEAVGRLTGGIAHEFNNIMTAIIGCSFFLKEELDKDTDLATCADQILLSAERAVTLTKGLLTYSRKQITHKNLSSLNEIILRVKNILSKLISEKIKLKIKITDEDLIVMVDKSQIEQVLMNLVTNAQDAMSYGGTLSMRTGIMTMDSEFIRSHGFGKSGMYAFISIEDTGEGMNERTKDKIFEPFFTTKDIGKGTGLGLSIVYGIIEKHNGYIEVESEPGYGTEFKIYLPLMKKDTQGTEVKKTQYSPTHGSGTILVAEDDEEVRNQIKLLLEKSGYKVVDAVDGEEALSLFMSKRHEIDLLLFDIVMPRMSGNEAYEAIKQVHPDVKTLFMSGYAGDVIKEIMSLERGLGFISKPFSPDELLARVREVLGSRKRDEDKKK